MYINLFYLLVLVLECLWFWNFMIEVCFLIFLGRFLIFLNWGLELVLLGFIGMVENFCLGIYKKKKLFYKLNVFFLVKE